MRAHRKDHAIGGSDRLAVHGNDDVALLDAGLVGRATRDDLGNVGALVHGEPVGAGVLGVHSLHREADVGMRDLLAANDLVGNLDGVVAGDGKADAREGLSRGRVERGDAHELALIVHERTAGVAGVDSSVNLDEVGVDGVARAGLQELVAVQRRDDALGDGLVEAKRAANGHDPGANVELGGVAHLDGGHGVTVEVGLDDREVGGGIGANHAGLVALAADGHADGGGTVNHVVVREDVAVRVENDAGAKTLTAVGSDIHRDHGGHGLCGYGLGRRRVGIARRDVDGAVARAGATRGGTGARSCGGLAKEAREAQHEHNDERCHNSRDPTCSDGLAHAGLLILAWLVSAIAHAAVAARCGLDWLRLLRRLPRLRAALLACAYVAGAWRVRRALAAIVCIVIALRGLCLRGLCLRGLRALVLLRGRAGAGHTLARLARGIVCHGNVPPFVCGDPPGPSCLRL